MKSISLVLMLIISTRLFSQQPVLTETEYLNKSKSQKTTAWVLAGGGTALIIVGLVAYGNKVDNTNNPFEIFDTSELIFTLLGGAALVGSKILFKASAKNKRRATSLSFKNEKIETFQNGNLAYKFVPAIALRLQL